MPYFNFSISFGVQSRNSQSFARIGEINSGHFIFTVVVKLCTL